MKRSRSLVLGAMAMVSGFAAGCGEEEISMAAAVPVAPAPAPVVAAPVAAPVAVPVAAVVAAPVAAPGTYDASKATCTLVFKAKVKGTPPKMRALKFDADPKCGEAHKEEVLKEDVVADKEGRLANVIVWVSKGSEAWTYDPKTEAASLDQKGCLYIPHVLTVQVGQAITVKNSDPVTHNIHSQPKDTADELNKGQSAGTADLTMKFAKEEVAVKVKCDIHSWMLNWVGVFAHPFHGVTGADGSVSIKIPPGEYEVSAWHEYGKWKSKPEAQKVKVAGTESKDVEFVYGVE